MKIVKLDINPDIDLSGVDAVALVERPAIEEDFMYFSKTEEFAETYNDYPQGAVDNAKMGIKRNEANGNKCATQVGKVRAQQLANKEPISLDTVRRMRAFLTRQKGNYDLAIEAKDYNRCGYISYLLWGGPEALVWAEKTLRMVEGGEEFDLDEACQPGYKALGTKIKNGRTVPNCIPADQFDEQFAAYVKQEIIKAEMEKIIGIQHEILDLTADKSTNDEFNVVGEVSGIPVYSTKEEAIAAAEAAGCKGYHEHELEGKVVYMPCEKHSEATDSMLKDGFSTLDEKQIVLGPLMKPNMLIPRLDDNGDPYHVYFTKETIQKIAYKMIKDKLIDRVNLEHDNMDKVDAYLVESWIIEDDKYDKSKKYGFNLPIGTWMGAYKIEDKAIWDEYVKTGLVKGFSVEGMFNKFAQEKCKTGRPCACGLSESGMCDGSHLNK